jgi:hypothetical protein
VISVNLMGKVIPQKLNYISRACDQKNFGKEHYLGEKYKLQWNIDSLYKLDCAGWRSASAAEPLPMNDSF